MTHHHTLRYVLLAAVLFLGVCWAVASASPAAEKPYPNAQYLITAKQLKQRLNAEEPLVIVDVRNDEHFDGKLIPGAIRLPWGQFRHDNPAENMGGLFIGVTKAQEVLGQHGIFRNDTVVLYDSIARDGGATASYVFWILDMLGHQQMMILERGIDGWLDAGGDIVNKPAEREPLLYQAPRKEIDKRRWADENFIYPRLGDPYYQIIDVRSRGEYLGEKLNTTLDDSPLKAGHIPGAYNVNYELNWSDPESKAIKSYQQLLELYRGIAPDKAVIVYCHSARRGSFGYFILRLMGFDDVMLYDNSWFGWGHPQRFYPVETTENIPPGIKPPTGIKVAGKPTSAADSSRDIKTKQRDTSAPAPDKSGYISCGG